MGFTPRMMWRAHWRRRVPTLLAIATVAAGVALTAAAWSLPRSRDAQARRALLDYTTYFTATVLLNAEMDVRRALESRVNAPTRAAVLFPGNPVLRTLDEWVAASERVDECRCVPRLAERMRFRYDERTGELQTAGDSVPPALRDWLRRRLGRMRDRSADATRGWDDGGSVVLYPGMHAPGVGVAVRYVHAPGNLSRVAYGYAAEFGPLLTGAVPRLMDRCPLFARALRSSEPTTRLVALSVYDPTGRLLFATSPPAPVEVDHSAAVKTTLGNFGGVKVRLAARPDVLDVLRPHSGRALIAGLGATFLVLVASTWAVVRQTRREAEQVHTRTTFLAGISHELRTPLTQILLFADTLEMGEMAEPRERRKAARIIADEAQRLGHLVDNVLHLVRGERNVAGLRRAPVPLAELVEEVAERFTPLAADADVSLELSLPNDVVAHVDRDAVTQVLLNLLDNAAKHAGPGPRRIVVGLERDARQALLWVEDDGHGVLPRERERIWKPFERGARSGGSGIGLAVVRDLVELHGGTVAVESASLGGARFIVRLPLAQAEEPALAPARA